jgi:hypothetical protein
VYALAMAEYLGLHRYHENDWEKVRQSLMQHHLFEDKTLPVDDSEPETSVQPVARPVETLQTAPPQVVVTHSVNTPKSVAAAPPRRVSRSGYLKRR